MKYIILDMKIQKTINIKSIIYVTTIQEKKQGTVNILEALYAF